MLKRIRAAILAGQHATAAAAPQQPAQDIGESNDLPGWALIHFGPGEPITRQLEMHRAFCLRRGLRCLFVSDDIPLLCVRSRDVLFEFVPWPTRTALSTTGRYAGSRDHSFRRLNQIINFWGVVGCTWEGDFARDLLDEAPDWAHPAIRASLVAKGTASQLRGNMINSVV